MNIFTKVSLYLQCHTNSMTRIKSEALRLRPVSKCGSLTVSRGGRLKAVHLSGRICVHHRQRRCCIYPLRCGLISFSCLRVFPQPSDGECLKAHTPYVYFN